MKVLEIGKGYTCIFRCPNCNSKLEAERNELAFRLGDDKVKFTCPVCNEINCVYWSNIKKEYK